MLVRIRIVDNVPSAASIISVVTNEVVISLILKFRAAGEAFEDGEIGGDGERNRKRIQRVDVTGKIAILGLDKGS